MTSFDPHAYGPEFAAVVDTDRRRPLDAGSPGRAPDTLKRMTAESAFAHANAEFAPSQPQDADMAACCLAGAWLLYDCLDESHAVSQGVDTPSGSFWHAIMHRREGDYSNAQYWFRRVGLHPVYDLLGQRAAELAAARGAEAATKKMITGGAWDAVAFVDLCRLAIRGQDNVRDLCLDIQQAEWELLFNHCYRAAVGE
jgi:hypothetical protein